MKRNERCAARVSRRSLARRRRTDRARRARRRDGARRRRDRRTRARRERARREEGRRARARREARRLPSRRCARVSSPSVVVAGARKKHICRAFTHLAGIRAKTADERVPVRAGGGALVVVLDDDGLLARVAAVEDHDDLVRLRRTRRGKS
eukprot:31454-Pelagococcus_subviridis.AAC.7